MTDTNKIGRVNTPLGKGRIIYKLKDGTYVVEFDHGGGKIFLPEELWPAILVQGNGEVTAAPYSQNR